LPSAEKSVASPAMGTAIRRTWAEPAATVVGAGFRQDVKRCVVVECIRVYARGPKRSRTSVTSRRVDTVQAASTSS
jgi:hypothetical protein